MIIKEITAKWDDTTQEYILKWSEPFEASKEYIRRELNHAKENKAAYYYKIINN
jgi:hypothetical protein